MAVVIKNPTIVVKGETNLLPYRMSNLGSYSVSDSNITSINTYAFYYDTHLTSIDCENVTNIGSSAFGSCSNLTTINFPSATTLGNSSFSYCSKIEAAIFPNVTSVVNYCFQENVKLANISFPKVTSILGYAFAGCILLTEVSFPLATSIADYSFTRCSALTTINFPLVTSIGYGGFQNCTSLVNVSFPKVTSIAARAFYGCTSLTTITLDSSTLCSLANIDAIPATSSHHITVYVPYSLIGSYQTATNWSTHYNNGYITFSPIFGTSATISTTVTNGSYSGATSITAPSTTATVTLSASSGYQLPSSITVTNASYTYDSTTGVVSLSNIIGNVTISATCTVVSSGYTVSINAFYDDGDWTTYYSLDNGSTWNEITGTGVLSNAATQIKFKAVGLGGTPMYCEITSTTLGLNFSQQGMNAGSWETSNYVLSSNVTDIVVDEQNMGI